ncbi:uncharacterized protein LTR77_005462 [Saxophila tyrrhenica]|uniref:Uncharacterized protein n=1 Tax=Saxophila tyrrhenica TaxID=1690608 RepID=A0AAV9P8J4_9PEZI|nr:hypothetical protein LTR77_005462 [Saxophila tyrrhenica]
MAISQSSRKAKIAIIGAGVIGLRHAQSVVACEQANLLCLVDPVFVARQEAEAFNVPLFESVAAMLQECKPDGAVVSTPNSTHVAVAKELLSAGVHVLVEKPISVDSSSGQGLVNHAEACGRRLLVGHHRRFNAYVTATKRALDRGHTGMPVAVSGLWMLRKPAGYFEPPTDWRASAAGGGVILINMIHEVDTLQYLLGPIIRVHAEQTLSQRGHEAEEGAAIVLRFASGVVGTFVMCDSTASKHNFESSTGENPIIPRAGADCYRIFGTEGSLSVGDMTLSRHTSSAQKSWTSPLSDAVLPVEDIVPFDDQMLHFVDVIRGGARPRCSGADGLRALSVCEAIKRSMAEAMPVDIVA